MTSPASSSSGWVSPVTLEGTHVRLEPLSVRHHDGLCESVCDGELWQLWYTMIPTPERMGDEIQRRLDEQDRGSMCPFAVVEPASGRAVGMTTYMNIDPANRRLEIGSTWYRQSVQRTALNTEAKRLLLSHAFDELNAIAVEFRTHFFNHSSRRAIERLGAKLDGVLRNHQITAHPQAAGTLRDTCVYSIIASEWPTVRANLDHVLSKSRKS
ncbi:MAG: GNAT family N-acetyltransferase [Mycobacterium sp.]|nr:GNAT family N-acetyltransferase [Mycobacterium sp.]